MEEKIKQFIDEANHIVIVQADNPDGDSLASALALEQILADKEVTLYCGVDIPTYLRYLEGWDRVTNELPTKFDASIIVDTSAINLLETATKNNQTAWLAAKPCLILDHHQTASSINFANILYAPEAVATGEVIYELATKLDWELNSRAKDLLAVAILSDSLGLITESTTARSIHIIAELVDKGVSLAKLENARREMQKKSPRILSYKGSLLQRVTYSEDQRIAVVTIPWEEIEKYSHEYNPPMLVIDEMKQVENVQIAIAFKAYPNGRVTAKLRSNYGYPICAELAEKFGGGGHPYASGFRVTDKPFEEVKTDCLKIASELLDKIDKS